LNVKGQEKRQLFQAVGITMSKSIAALVKEGYIEMQAKEISEAENY
jgi:hypothetical protein